MSTKVIAGAVLGFVISAAAGTAGYQYLNRPQFADVVSVKPIKEIIRTPREECHSETITHQRPVQDENRVAGTAIGAVIGGVLGHQVGGGRGKKLATVAGAAAGGYAGNEVQKGMQERDTYTTVEQRCRTVTDTQEKISGYEVTYVFEGRQGMLRMDEAPAERIPADVIAASLASK